MVSLLKSNQFVAAVKPGVARWEALALPPCQCFRCTDLQQALNHDVDVSRRAKKRIGDVPHNIRDAYLKFLERGENIQIRCGTNCRGLPEAQLPSAKHWCEVKLVGDEYIDHTFSIFA